MNNVFTLKVNDIPVALDIGRFPDGAVYCRLAGPLPVHGQQVRIYANGLINMDQFMALAQLMDILRRRYRLQESILELPFLPYARQDRYTTSKDSFALKIFGQLLNQLQFDKIIVLDVHSDVAGAVVDRLHVIPQHQCMRANAAVAEQLASGRWLIAAPDAGALKKIHDVAATFQLPEYAALTKQRDPATGQLTGFDLLFGDVDGQQVMIVDDICDGGGTFIGAAEVLRRRGARSVALYVTHGIFSRGVDNLLNNGIDRIFTTDSYPHHAASDARVSVTNAHSLFAAVQE